MTESWIVPGSVHSFALAKISEGLTEIDRRRLFQFLMRVHNASPKARQLAERFDSGEIDGDTLWKLLG